MKAYEDAGVTLHQGDCLDILPTLPDCSVDAVVTDPPYGLEFMGKTWDGADGFRRSLNRNDVDRPNVFGRTSRTSPEYRALHTFQQWCEQWAAECLRVLKPGGAILAFGGTRTFHRLACAIEDAGFEVRESLAWIHGQGFPKNRNVSEDLRSLPACSCGIGAEVANDGGGIECTGTPAGTIRAGAGTEPGAVSPATSAADLTQGIVPKVIATRSANSRASDVDSLYVDGCREGLPIVLGSPSVTGATEGEQVTEVVSGVQRNPEPLGDQMVGEQSIGGATVGAGHVSSDDRLGDVSPASSLVLPLAAAPGRIAGSVETPPVVDGHAGTGTVDARICPAAELIATDGANMDSVTSSLHANNSTAKRPFRCEVCGGIRGPIPDGLGTALKPAFEPIVVARKPLESTVAGNVLQHGTGALNIDGCRIGSELRPVMVRTATKVDARSMSGESTGATSSGEMTSSGRWPANVVLDSDSAELLDQQSGTVRSSGHTNESSGSCNGSIGPIGLNNSKAVPGVNTYSDTGGASRFFYTAKADSTERPTHNGIAHPTVKPLDLMRWLVRLVTPPGGTVLEPFAGSGTTVEAALLEGFRCIAIEREADYLPLILQRIHRRRDPVAYLTNKGEDLGLFGEESA